MPRFSVFDVLMIMNIIHCASLLNFYTWVIESDDNMMILEVLYVIIALLGYLILICCSNWTLKLEI